MLQSQDTIPIPQNLRIESATSSGGGDSVDVVNQPPVEQIAHAAAPSSYPVVNTSTMAASQRTLDAPQSLETIRHSASSNGARYVAEPQTDDGFTPFDGCIAKRPIAQHLHLVFTTQHVCDNIVRVAGFNASVGLWWGDGATVDARFSFHVEDGMDSELALALYGVRIHKWHNHRVLSYKTGGKVIIEEGCSSTLTEADLAHVGTELGEHFMPAILNSLERRVQEILWGGMQAKTNCVQMKIYSDLKFKTRVDVWGNVDVLSSLMETLTSGN
ncbi:hypothetical protein EDB80DRAFT_735023 [Ilyonectria destructans]|nr:hypothetical protein EDB80DRAFT_735023 [Ilyonectria destructans]